MSSPAIDRTYLRSIALGYRLSQALFVFAELGVADLLTRGPASAQSIAEKTSADPAALQRLLRVAQGMGLVAEQADGHLTLTDRGRLLCRDAEDSMWPRVRSVGESWHWGPWRRLLDTVVAGRSAFEMEHGISSFDYFDRTPGAGDTMMNRVTDEARQRGYAIADAFDFSSVQTVVDVGGGRGGILAAILRRHPHLRGVLFDLPYAVADAAAVFSESGVADRSEVVGGDFRVDLPRGGDVYLLSAVVHSWSDDESVRLLGRCFAQTDRVLVADEVIDPDSAQMDALLKDLQLMVFSGGRLRSLEEYHELFARAGAKTVRHAPLSRNEVLVEGAR
ncbi:methyltransferase [Micromonospora sp. DT228]|uniref:methyltransferase n=1 Tax=Micromonospora sp. DT228 TaxID=3393443 RepID=UPI003CF467C1